MRRLLVGIIGSAFLMANLGHAATYYYGGSGDAADVNSWWSNTDGTGAHPSTINAAGQILIVQTGQTATATSTWSTSGSGTTLTVQANATFDAGASNPKLSSLNLGANSTFKVSGSFGNIANLGTIDPNSTFEFSSSTSSNFRSFTWGNVIWNSTSATNPTNDISATGNLNIGDTNAATLTMLAGSGATLHTYTVGGNVVINSGNTLAFSSGSSSSTGPAVLNIGGGLINNGTISRGSGGSSALINFDGAATSEVTWGNTSGAFNVTIGSDRTITFLDNLSDFSGILTINGVLTTSPSKTVTVGTAFLIGGTINGLGTVSAGTSFDIQSGSVSAALAGAATLTKSTGGIATLSGINAYTGGTTIGDGTLSFANGALGSSGAITMNGGTLQWNGSNTQDISSRLAMVNSKTAIFDTNGNDVSFESAVGSSSTGALTKTGDGRLTLNATSTYTGGTTVSAGTLALSGGDNRLSNSGAITVSGGTLDLGGNSQTTSATVTLSGGTIQNGTLIGGSYAVSSGVLSASLSGDGAMNVSGSATLSGDNSGFSGNIAINSGTLTAAHANALGTGTTTVNSGGTLAIGDGVGLVESAKVALNHGTLLGGSDSKFAGTLSGSGTLDSLTLTSEAIIEWSLNDLSIAPTSVNQYSLAGQLALGGAAVQIAGISPSADPFWSSNRSWVLVSKGSGTITSTLAPLSNTGWSSYGTFSTGINVNGDLTLDWTAAGSPIPEPSTYALLIGGTALVWVAVRRRRVLAPRS